MKQDVSHELLTDLPALEPGNGLVRNLQGVNFRVLPIDKAVDLLDARVCAKNPAKVAIANAHTLNTVRRNDKYRQALERFTVFNDGIGIDMASFMRYGQRFPANLNGTDFLPAFLERTSLQLRVFLLGAQAHVVERAFDEARRRFPRHEWLGYNDGYFTPQDEAMLCERIRACKPDLLLVAMGNPLQEFWIDRCAASTGAVVCVGVGALFDFLSGEVSRAPAWVRRSHLEWGYRLVQEPGRMWRRYLIGNLSFLWHAWRDRS